MFYGEMCHMGQSQQLERWITLWPTPVYKCLPRLLWRIPRGPAACVCCWYQQPGYGKFTPSTAKYLKVIDIEDLWFGAFPTCLTWPHFYHRVTHMCQMIHGEVISCSYKQEEATENTRRLRVSMYCGYEHRHYPCQLKRATCSTGKWHMKRSLVLDTLTCLF